MKRKRKTKKPMTESVGNVTVKIYRRKKGANKYFEVSDYSGGFRRLRSFNDEEKAREQAKKIAGLIATGQTTAAAMGNREAASYGRAVELLRAAGIETPLELVASIHVEAVKLVGSAEKIMPAIEDYARRNPIDRPQGTVRKVADELIELKTKRGASDRYLQDLKYQLDKICNQFPNQIDTVTTGDLQLWFDKLDAAPRTVRNIRSAAAALFKFAEARCYIGKGDNPAHATERIKAKNGDDIEIYAPDEVARLLAASPDTIKPLVAMQAFTGIRTAELVRLDWSHVKFDRMHIEITAANAKTASRRIVPILPNLAAWLKPHIEESGKLFGNGVDYYHQLLREAATKTSTKDAPAVKLKQNGLRHSFISYRVADTQNVAQVALEAGNSPQMIFAHYREIVTKEDAQKWFSIQPEAAK